MRRLEIPELDWLREIIDYDPETGRTVWAVDRPPGAKAGRLVGTLDPGTSTLTTRIQGRRYQVHHLIWYMRYAVWPAHQILFRDKDPTNLALRNLRSVEDVYSQKPKAIAARRRRNLKAARQAYAQQAREVPDSLSGYAYIYDAKMQLWSIRDIADPKRVLTRFKTKEDAEAYIEERQRAVKFIERYNEAFKFKPGDDLILAGTSPYSETYQEIADLVAYNPDDGNFYYRAARSTLDNLRADFTATTGRQVVTIFSRYFSTAMLAWFLTHREWPKPKSVGWRDGNPKNNRLSNLMLIKARR